MLGTPNRGSFAIPLTLSGAEKVLKVLAVGDVDHSLPELLEIVSTFPGMYQMLPSPLVDLGDDHAELFDVTRWGKLPAKAPLLAKADAFLRELDAVIDPERLLYVAGVNRETPAKIRIESDGKFSYRQTLDGDGRVPHELGLLEGVTTYWVERDARRPREERAGARRDHGAPADGPHDGAPDDEAGEGAEPRGGTGLAVRATP